MSIGNNLVRGKSKSCGCLRKELVSKKYKTHGDSNSRLCKIWYSIRGRILCKTNERYKDYGGRGIKLCERWMKYENFKEDMYPLYLKHVQEFGEHETTIERKDVNGNYCPENCIWATYHEQALNTRKTVRLNYGGREYTLSELSREFGIDRMTLTGRLKKGWTVEKSISVPINYRFLSTVKIEGEI